MDKKEALKQIKAGDFYLGSADDKFKSDKEVVLAAVKKSGSDLEYADKKLRADKKIVLAAVKQDGMLLQYADKKLKADKKIVLAAVKQNGHALGYTDKKLQADKKVVLTAVKKEGYGFEYADKKLKADKKIVLATVKQYGQSLGDVDVKLKADKKIVLAAVKQNGEALQHANEKFRADKEVILTAVKSYGDALRFANKKLKADKKIVLTAVKQSDSALQFANEKLKEDKEVVRAALKDEELVDKYFQEKLAKTRGKEEVLNQINKCLQTSGDLNEGRAGYASVIEHERETGTFAIFGDDEDEEEVTEIEGYIISENKTGGEVIWNLPDSTDNFLATLEQIEWVTADDEDVKDTITYDDINFSDSRGIGSTAYDTNNKEITEYDEFQGGGDTEVIYLNSTYKPTEITVNFKSKESVIFDNVNSENENYTAKITGETIGVLKNYSDVLMVVRTLLGK